MWFSGGGGFRRNVITCAGGPFRWVDFGAVSVGGEVFYVAMGPSID